MGTYIKTEILIEMHIKRQLDAYGRTMLINRLIKENRKLKTKCNQRSVRIAEMAETIKRLENKRKG